MIDLFVLIIFCCFLANQITIYSKKYDNVWLATKKNANVKIMYFILLVALVLFSGLRTSYNDTRTYMQAYTFLEVGKMDLSILQEEYGGFMLFQKLLKKYISEDPQVLIFSSAVLINILYLWFFAKHSSRFDITLFAYFILGPYVFSMAGVKQAIAMAIALLAIDNLLKKRYLKFALWILVAMTFHPYIICMLVLPLLFKGIWTPRMLGVFVLITIISSNLELLLGFAGLIGKDYSLLEMTSYTINPVRVMVEVIPVLISFFCRKKLKESHDKFLNLGINMMIINAIMISLGLFLNPIYFGRIGTYFSTINAVIVPQMLNKVMKKNGRYKLNLLIYYGVYAVHFVLDMTKLGSISISYDFFKHIGLF